MKELERIKIGVLTSSDRASAGIYEDISGKAVQEVMSNLIKNQIDFIYQVCPDEIETLKQAIQNMIDSNCDIIVTTGGTGPAKRDVVPEVMEQVCEKMLPGFGEQMRQVSLQYVPTAILSRQSAGIAKSSFILNLPGKPKSIEQCLEAVFGAIPYCVDLIGGRYIQDSGKIKAFRPNK